jgi:hypothetical protein
MVMPLNQLARVILTDVTSTPRSDETERQYVDSVDEAKAWLSTVGGPEGTKRGEAAGSRPSPLNSHTHR